LLNQAIPSLHKFAQIIGEDPVTVVSWEEFDQIFFETQHFQASKATSIKLSQLMPLVNVFGEALTCQFSLHKKDLKSPDEYPVVLDVKQGINQSEITHFRQRIQTCQSLYFYFQIDKECLLKNLSISAQNCAFYLYFFPKALIHFLRGETTNGIPCNVQESLRVLEDNLWPENLNRKAVLLVLDWDIHVNGKYLAVIGGIHLLQWQEVIPTVAPDFERLNSIYDDCRESVAWDERWVMYLTPPRLRLDQSGDLGDPIVSALQIHLLNLIVLFTANRTSGSEKEWCGTYADSICSKDMLLLSPAQKELESQILAHIDSLYEIFTWAYDSEWPRDRIPFVQSAISQELMHRPESDVYKSLLDKSETILTSLDRRWRQFIHQRIQTYSAEERELEDFVIKTVDAFAERVTTMVKAVSDTMLAAIAALFGSFIAAGFGSDNFNIFIFSIGMIAYSLYVLAFPLIYSMSNQWTYYKALQESMQAGLERFTDELGEDNVSDIVGNRLAQSNRRFKLWFFITIAVYFVAIILGLLSTTLVPKLFTTPA
jgi:hypothetical protein